MSFLLVSGGLIWLGRRVSRRAASVLKVETPAPVAVPEFPEKQEASWDDVALVDPLGLEVGYRLISLVDRAQSGELLGRIKSIRKKFAQDIGFLVPVVHIRDNLEIKPHAYVIRLKGVQIGQGEALPGQWMAINPGQVSATLPGTPTSDPAFGLPAIWIDSSLREQAQIYGYTVVDASTVVATHLNHLIHTHAAELLGRQEVQQLLDHVGKDSPLLVQDLVPKSMSLTTVQKVLKNLLDEEVPIRDMRTILEVLAEHAATVTDTTELTSLIRLALSRAIIQQIYPGNEPLQVIGLDSSLDRILLQALSNSSGLEPGLADSLLRETQSAMERQMQQGLMPVLVVQHPLRVLLSRFLRRNLTQLKVLSQAEIPDNRTIKVTATIGGRT